MKKMLIATVLALAVITPVYAQTTHFDKFKNETHISTEETVAGGVTLSGGRDASPLVRRVTIVTGFTCKGQVDKCNPRVVELLFIAYTADWSMNGHLTVNLLIDGVPDTAGKSDWDGHVSDARNLIEYIDTNISPELLLKLSKAKAVSVQIGSFEFDLTGSNLVELRNLANHLSK